MPMVNLGDAHCVEAELPQPGELLLPTVISGRITTENGKPIQATVRLEQHREEIAQSSQLVNKRGSKSNKIYAVLHNCKVTRILMVYSPLQNQDRIYFLKHLFYVSHFTFHVRML